MKSRVDKLEDADNGYWMDIHFWILPIINSFKRFFYCYLQNIVITTDNNIFKGVF